MGRIEMRATRAARFSATGLWLGLLVLGCGRSLLPVCEGAACVNYSPDACLANGQCLGDQICLRGTCVHAGDCVTDEECPGAMICEEEMCAVDLGQEGPHADVARTPCEINDDCAPDELCLQGSCCAGVECTEHGHCPADTACALGQCWDID